MSNAHEDQIKAAMQKLGFANFKSDVQRQMIEAVTAGNDVLSIMPTGGGKTAGAVVPAVVHGWFVIVISPLKSLMANQVDKLTELGIPAFKLTGDQTEAEKFEVREHLRGVQTGPAFLFVSPEMAGTETFYSKWIKGITFDLMFVDEVHCVSTWGNSFRKKYQRVRAFWGRLRKPQILAASATEDPQILADIMRRVPFRRKHLVEIRDDPIRPNLNLLIEHPDKGLKSQKSKREWAIERLKLLLSDDRMPTHGPTIVYCTRTRETEMLFTEVVDLAEAQGFTAALYHSKLEREHKANTMRIFKSANKPLIIATSAFGMGIDRDDVRMIVHYGPPADMIEYAQQIGRAGRDGLAAYCLTFYLDWMVDRSVQAELSEIPDLEMVEQIYKRLRRNWKDCQERQETRFNLDAFNRLYAEWLRSRNNIHDPDRRIALREQSIDILVKLGYVRVEGPHVYDVKSMQFGTDTHEALIEMTGMHTRNAQRNAQRVRSFFMSEDPDQKLLFAQIADG